MASSSGWEKFWTSQRPSILTIQFHYSDCFWESVPGSLQGARPWCCLRPWRRGRAYPPASGTPHSCACARCWTCSRWGFRRSPPSLVPWLWCASTFARRKTCVCVCVVCVCVHTYIRMYVYTSLSLAHSLTRARSYTHTHTHTHTNYIYIYTYIYEGQGDRERESERATERAKERVHHPMALANFSRLHPGTKNKFKKKIPSNRLGKLAECAFIGRLGLILDLGGIRQITLGNHRMADGQNAHEVTYRLCLVAALPEILKSQILKSQGPTPKSLKSQGPTYTLHIHIHISNSQKSKSTYRYTLHMHIHILYIYI